MYKLNKPSKRHSAKAWLVIIPAVLLIAAGFYFLVIKDTSGNTKIKNGPALISNVASADASITINEPLFSLDLPGQWKETARDPDPKYQSIQWNFTGKASGNRWFRIYADSIPTNLAFNYLQPVEASGNKLSLGQMSENCVTFTQGATPSANRDVSVPQSQAALPARWQAVSFMCDNSHVSHQVVGTGSAEGSNAVTVNGPEHGLHKYFFVYDDDNYHADYSIFSEILSSFKAK